MPLHPGPDGSLALSPASGTGTFTDTKLGEADLTADPAASHPGRLAFRTPPLRTGVRLSGTPTVDLRVTLDKPTSNLTALLRGLRGRPRTAPGSTRTCNDAAEQDRHDGPCRGSATDSCPPPGEHRPDDACSREGRPQCRRHANPPRSSPPAAGWMPENRHSVTTPEPLTPGRSYRITWKTLPNDYEIKPGHRLGLVLGGTDADFLYFEEATGAKVAVDLGGSTCHHVPVTAAEWTLRQVP
ncbi:hypothetical protein SANTM175S_09858 [Streptomyces antimycoticus]